MSRHTENLDRLLSKLQARYGEHDAVVCELRGELLRCRTLRTRQAAPEGLARERPVRSPSLASQAGLH